jgi:exopolysaccharide biosynthesis polyprenyl glycosylphosphotransferase
MFAVRRRILIQSAKWFDTLVMMFALGAATLLVASRTPSISLAQFLSVRVKLGNFLLFAAFVISWRLIFTAFGLYESYRLSTRRAEAYDVLAAVSVCSLALWMAAPLFRVDMVTPLFMVFWAVATVATLLIRLLRRDLLGRLRARGHNLRQVLVVGTNPRALRFAQRAGTHPELGYTLAGFVDDIWFGQGEYKQNGHKLVADFQDFLPYLRTHVVDEVVIALPMESAYRRAHSIAAECEEQGIIVRVLPDIFSLRLARPKAVNFEGQDVITLYTGAADKWQLLLKRPLDIALALAALAVAAPIGALAALAIKLTSPGPVFFVQERVGLNKRRFRLYKFRTMVPDAEQRQHALESLNEATGAVFKIKNDPRITPVGRLLRKLSIDELPQLLNVLKGDMSMVGPRPLPVRDYNGFDQDWERRRFSVRPGLTCLWQINGRSSTPFHEWMHLDMEYIDHWSLGLDLKILAKTIPAVVRGSGAA